MLGEPRLQLVELSLSESARLSGGDCTLQYRIGYVVGSAVRATADAMRAVVSFGEGVAAGLGGR